jgi:hypothetical protein
MTDTERAAPSDRTYRRLRGKFRRELLGDAKPSPSDSTLIDLATQAALRVRQMKAEIAAGQRVADEDLVRIIRAANSVLKEFRGRATTAKAKTSLLQRKLAHEGKPS